MPDAPAPENWSPTSWSSRASNVGYAYDDAAQVESCVRQIARMPPLVTSGEVEKLIEEIAGAQRGERFLLQGGDCAETLEECRPDVVTSKLKILLQMSLVMVFAGRKPVIRVGRIAGQYAKPRSSANETRAGVSLPSYFGDLINRAPFTPEARRPDPRLMAEGYQHAAVTLNFVRSLMSAGFADIHHPEQWDLGFLRHAGLTSELRERYQALTRRLTESVNFMEAIGERDFGQLTSVRFYTSHEGLNLHYESAQTRSVPRKAGYWNLTTHMPWVGERTRALDGAHIEYFRGIRNPVGVKIGPSTTPAQVIALIEALNPANLAGKLVLIPRMGASRVREKLPALARAVVEARKTVLWVCDPMHGNGVTTSSGIKTRNFADILSEINGCWDVLRDCGTHLGGVHIELTGEDVTECLGGASGLNEADLSRNYASLCDPRLNYEQAMELALLVAHRMQQA